MPASVQKKHPLILVASLQKVVRYSKLIDDGVTITEVSLRPVPYALLSHFLQRASQRIKKRKKAARVASATFNVVPTATVTALGGGMIIEIGNRPPAQRVVVLVMTLPAYVFRTLDGMPHRVIRVAAVVAAGAARVPEPGMHRPHERREILALTKDSWS
jgi:hypothetical protein